MSSTPTDPTIRATVPQQEPVTQSCAAQAVEDQLCLARMASVDRAAAVGELYDRYGRVVFGVVQRIVGDPPIAAELTAEAFHVATQEARTYRSRNGTVPGWLLGIAGRVALEWCRAHGKSALQDTSGLAAGARRLVERNPGTRREVEQLRLAVRRVANR